VLLILQIFVGSLNIFLGILYLILPIIFIEFARPRDFIKAFLLLLLGIYLIISFNISRVEDFFVLTVNSSIILLLSFEVLKDRFLQLSEKEKKDFRNIKSIKSKILIFGNALKITLEKIKNNILKINLLGNNLTQKKWVRSNTKENFSNSKILENNNSPTFLKTTNTPKKDIMRDEKI